MHHSFLLAQLVGLLAATASVSSVTMTCDRRLRRIAAIGQCTWMIHFFLLGSLTTAVMAGVMSVRQVSSAWLDGQSETARRVTTALFYVAFTLVAVVTWAGVMSLLPWGCAVLANFAYSTRHSVTMRKALRLCDCIGLTNSSLLGSLGGVITACLAIALNTLTLRKMARVATAAPHAVPSIAHPGVA